MLIYYLSGAFKSPKAVNMKCAEKQDRPQIPLPRKTWAVKLLFYISLYYITLFFTYFLFKKCCLIFLFG